MISAKPWNLEAVARLFLGVIVTLCVGAVLAGLLESPKIHLSEDKRQFVEMTVMLAFFQGAALIWIDVFLRQSNISWSMAFGLRPPSRIKTIAAGVTVGLVVLPAAWLLQMVSQFAMELLHFKVVAQSAVEELQSSTLSVPEKIVMGLFTIVFAPIAEESLFRGILYPTVKQLGYPRLALWGTSVLFGLMHFNMVTLVPLVFLALVLTFLYEATDSLLAPIATHGMFNAVNFFYLIFAEPINRLLQIQ